MSCDLFILSSSFCAIALTLDTHTKFLEREKKKEYDFHQQSTNQPLSSKHHDHYNIWHINCYVTQYSEREREGERNVLLSLLLSLVESSSHSSDFDVYGDINLSPTHPIYIQLTHTLLFFILFLLYIVGYKT